MAKKPDIAIKAFDQLTPAELHGCLRVRCMVFVVGQRICDVPDVDERDPVCHHVLLRADGAIVGTARLLPMDNGQRVKMGRLAVLPEQRGHGHARAIFDAVHAWLDHRGLPAEMHGQRYLESFYATLGWRTVGEPFQEAGIEHVKMIRQAAR